MRFVTALILAVGLYASQCDMCGQKFQNASVSIKNKLHYCANGKRISPFPGGPDSYFEPLTHTYISTQACRENIVFKYPYKEKKVRLFNKEGQTNAVIQKRQCGLRLFGRLQPSAQTGTLLHGMCCHGLGLVVPRGVLGPKYINHLLQSDTPVFGDVGFRVDESMRVRFVNPYYDIDIQKGMKITGFENRCAYEDAINLHEVGTTVTLVTAREGKKEFNVYKRFGGGHVSDTFLEPFGMRFDKNLQISTISKGTTAWQKGLRKGDILVEIEHKSVSTPNEVKAELTKQQDKESITYLFERDGFQFFIHI